MHQTTDQDLRKNPRSKSFYRPELDVLRLIAFMAVFTLHAFPRNAGTLSKITNVGGLGMSLFFVLSAFLITELLRLEKQRTGTVQIRAFYLRRILRIWPLYLTFTLFSVVVGLFIKDVHIRAGAVISMLLLFANWYFIVTPWKYLGGFVSALWSISLEEQFYLIWPSLGRHLSRRAFAMVSVGVILVGMVAIFYLCSHQTPPMPEIWTNSFVEFQLFAMGALLALALDGRIPRYHPTLRIVLLIVSITLLSAAELRFHIIGQDPRSAHTLILAYLCAGLGSCGLLMTFLGLSLPGWTKPLVYLGKISYGLYVFHIMSLYISFRVFGHVENRMAQVAKLIFAMGLTIGLAALSYNFLEKPFVRLKERFAIIPSRKA